MDYGFTHEGKVFTPNGTTGIDTADNETRHDWGQCVRLRLRKRQ
jgi:hypothetical protein